MPICWVGRQTSTPPGGYVRVGAKLLPRVFERFVKTPSSTGSGLGLAIVHDIVTAHGSKIEIESALGSGTTVRLKVPSVPPPSS